jgi:hypothetical protein
VSTIQEIHFPVIPVNLAVEEPGILDGKYDQLLLMIRVKPTIAKMIFKAPQGAFYFSSNPFWQAICKIPFTQNGTL